MLLSAFYQYKVYLDKHLVAVNESHHAFRIDLDIDKTSLVSLNPSLEVLECYNSLVDAIENKPLYAPVFLQDFAPTDRYERRQWLQNIEVPFPAMIYSYAHGNSYGSLGFIWKVGDEINHNEVSQVILQISSRLPVFALRDVRRLFVQKYNHFCGTPKSVLRHIFSTLTGDQTSALSGKY